MRRLCTAIALGGLLKMASARAADDPLRHYHDKQYDAALQGFLQLQTEHPSDLGLAMNVGSAHYRLKQYELAERAFAQAAQSPDAALRAQAVYNMGNTAFLRGKLDEAESRYQQVLTLDPNDRQARQNLAYVRQVRQQQQRDAKRRESEEQKEQKAQKQAEQQKQAADAAAHHDKAPGGGADQPPQPPRGAPQPGAGAGAK
ncbi:MAG: tetratricopeptide repeat protein, partial [Deltaproteobacteria bacterium]